MEECFVVGPVHGDLVLPFMAMFGTQDLVDDIAVVGQEDESGRILVEPAYRENSFFMADLCDDVTRYVGLTGRRDSDWFVILEVDGRHPPWNDFPVMGNDVAGAYLVAVLGDAFVDRHQPGFDESVSLPPRADPMLREEFVDAK